LLIKDYFDAIQARIDAIRADESDKIAEVARICADSIAAGGVLHIHDTGHMLNTELSGRAGGLVGFTPFSYGINVASPNSYRMSEDPAPDLTAEIIALSLRKSTIRTGDVLFVGSVSGKSEGVVELALQAKEMGVTTVGVSSIAYSSALESQHPSGKRLFEVVDIALDNHAPYGDGMLEVEGLDATVCPASGLCAATIMWAVMAGTIESLLAKGIVPTVYKSVNAPGGPEDVNARQQRYKELGY